MTQFVFANNVNTSLAAPISNSATTLTLASSANLPGSIPAGEYFALTINDAATRLNYEIVYATAVSGATLTVIRAQEGTAAQAWGTGDFAYSGPTAGQMESFDTGGAGVTSFNTRTGAVTLNGSDVNTALGYTAANAANVVNSFNTRKGSVVLNSADVDTALGYTPANDASVVHIAGSETITGVKTFPQVIATPVSDPDTRGFIAKPAGAGTAYGSFGALAQYGQYVCNNLYYNGTWHQIDATKYSSYINLRWDNGSFNYGVMAPGSSAPVQMLFVDNSGNATITGTCTATGYDTAASSRTVKHDIAPCRYGLAEFLQIPWVEYRYDACITDDDRLHFGSIVEDVEPVAPLLVKRRDGKVPTFEYDQFIPVIGRSLQQYIALANDRADKAEAQLAALAERVAQLEARA